MGLQEEFELLWTSYPRKVAKRAAFREYVRARESVSYDQIHDGLERFRRHLPEDMQFIPHFRTWLYQGRWDDCYEPLARPQKPRPVETVASIRERHLTREYCETCLRYHGPGQCQKLESA